MSTGEGPAVQIRLARPEDAEALLHILAPYVIGGTVSFEHLVPTVQAFREKIERIQKDYPFYIAVVDGKPVGYCYASRFRGPAAYDWAVETTIYIDSACHGHGIGRRLYGALEETLARQQVVALYACISAAHVQSAAFHRRLGYQEMARFHGAGFKMGEWLDIIWLEKRLGPLPMEPLPFIPLSVLGQGS